MKIGGVGNKPNFDIKKGKKRDKSDFQRAFGLNEPEKVEAPEESGGADNESREGIIYINEDYSKLIEKIDESSEDFLSSPSIEKLKEYKSLVASLIKKAVKDIYKIEDLEVVKLLDEKKYKLIKKINADLFEMTEGLLDSQKQTLDYIEKIDDIRGLLINVLK